MLIIWLPVGSMIYRSYRSSLNDLDHQVGLGGPSAVWFIVTATASGVVML